MRTDAHINPCERHVITSLVRPRSSIQRIQPAVWTRNRSLLVASRAKAFPGRPTNSDSTLPRVAHLDGGVIGNHHCIISHSGNATASPDMRPTPAFSRLHTIHHLHPCTHPTHHCHDYLHTWINCDKLVRLSRIALAFVRSSSGVCGNSTTATSAVLGWKTLPPHGSHRSTLTEHKVAFITELTDPTVHRP